MFKKFDHIFQKYSESLIFLWLLLVSYISYGKTLLMYWWVDDWTLLYKMVHPGSSVGYIGAGILGQGAYKYTATPFILLYPLFGTNAMPYFAIGLFLYFLAAFTVYLLAKEITKNKLAGFIASTIYASGYIASFALYRVNESYQFSLTAIFINLTALLLVKYLLGKGSKFYALSLIFYILTIQFLFLRSHGVFIIMFALISLLSFKKGLKNITNLIIKFLPFLVIYLFMYMHIYTNSSESSGAQSSGFMGTLINNFLGGQFVISIGNLFGMISHIIVPDLLVNNFSDFLQLLFKIKISLESLSHLNGLLITLFIVSVGLFIRKKTKTISNILLLGLVFVVSNIVSYFVYNPTNSLDSVSRYALPSFVGTTFIYSGLFLIIKDHLFFSKRYGRFLAYLFIGALCVYLIFQSQKVQDEIVNYISFPTQNAYKVIKANVPKVDKDTVFFIDAEDEPRVKNNILSGMGEVGISIFYNYEGNTKIANTFPEVYDLIASGKYKLENIYTFFASEKLGFVPTTEDFRKELTQRPKPLVIDKWDYSGSPVFVESEVGYPSLVPTVLNLTLSFDPSAVRSTVGKEVKITVWWMTERRNTYQTFYSQDLNILADGRSHNYTLYLPPAGLTIKKIRIDGYPAGGKIQILNSVIWNLTFPEIPGKNIPYYY